MSSPDQPSPVPTADLAAYFQSRQIAFSKEGRLDLGFGRGRDQYHLFHYPAPAAEQSMGMFLEWHTEDFFDSPDGPHLAIGLRGPTTEDPHRGRGLALGILASRVIDPASPERMIPRFEGGPEPPGGPAFFIEDFSINEGTAPIQAWQMTRCKPARALQNDGVYRIDIHVSKGNAWAGIWQVSGTGGDYRLLGQSSCCEGGPASGVGPCGPCPEATGDIGVGNAFIGTGFANPLTRSWLGNIYIAHWRD